jgi:catechol 2,3-dioxygenase-like lactoylglutathione lyase family enzyme
MAALVPLVWASGPALAQQSGAGLLRTALIVADAERSLSFYRLLGYQTEADTTSPRTPADSTFPINASSTAVRLVILAATSSPSGRIGLVQFSEPPARTSREWSGTVGLGDIVLVFDVTDADAVHVRLVEAGARVLEPPQAFISRTRDASGRAQQGKVFHVLDPDGYLIELLQAAK